MAMAVRPLLTITMHMKPPCLQLRPTAHAQRRAAELTLPCAGCNLLIDELAARLLKDKLVDSDFADEPFDERLMRLVAACPGQVRVPPTSLFADLQLIS